MISVQRSLSKLNKDPLVSQRVAAGGLKVHGALYDVGTGLLKFLEGQEQIEPPLEAIPPPVAALRTGSWRSQDVYQGGPTLIDYDIKFSQAHSAPPNIVLGLFGCELVFQGRVSWEGHVSNITTTGFHLTIQAAGNTQLFRTAWNWLEIPTDGTYNDFQTGVWGTNLVHSGAIPQQTTSQLVVFPQPYTSPPAVVVWIKGFDSKAATSVVVSAYPTNITTTGFVVHLDGASLYGGSVSWAAYPSTTLSGVSSGTIKQSPAGGNTNETMVLPNSQNPAAIFTAISGISSFAFHPTNRICGFTTWDTMTTTGGTWRSGTWNGSPMQWLFCMYFAIPPIRQPNPALPFNQ
jgi:H-type lectin domain